MIKNELFIPILIIMSSIQLLSFDEMTSINISSTINTGVVIMSLFRIVSIKQSYAKITLHLSCWLFCVYLINLFFSPYGSIKWSINTLGFLLLFVDLSNSCKNLGEKQIELIRSSLNTVFFCIQIFLIFLFAIILLGHSAEIKTLMFEQNNNSVFAFLAHDYGIGKQGFGNLIISLFLWRFLQWKSLASSSKLFFICFLLLGIPFLIGIRTLLLSFVLSIVFITFSYQVIILTLLLLCTSFLLFPSNIFSFIVSNYDRSTSLYFALSSLIKYPFGIGNGGYSDFVMQYPAEVSRYITNLGTGDKIKDFWIAPESDLVYFIASFGFLSFVFFCIYGYLIQKTRLLFFKYNLSGTDKFFLLLMIFIIFSGISQDNAYTMTWWIYFSLAFGTILKYTLIENEQTVSNY